MLEAKNLTKNFGDLVALDNISLTIQPGSIFGLIGTNGAGKSTFLRIAVGILRPQAGSMTIDGQNVYENPAVKERFFYISDQQYFFNNCAVDEIANYYARLYPNFDRLLFTKLIQNFELPQTRKINHFSKGMKKQVSILAAIAARTDYIFCDETFDGLDPVIRQGVKSLMAAETQSRGLTPIIASHNLRELEDICDHVGLLHKGGMLLNRDIDDMKMGSSKIQCIFTSPKTAADFADINIVSFNQRGSLYTIIARGSAPELTAKVTKHQPEFIEVLPLTLEEIFISETEVQGYDIKKLLV